ncbi:MAG: cell division protein FtsX [Alphaproteobacteria bacterium]|nr:cell division protein FtsX [Alphaproteobacteria bacterium]|tara:strand:- start:3349 stop:4221 length:873 start_codon:yes stop_codon:yes gene_type:complete
MKPKETPLLPVEDAREAALFFVVGALCFLAALAALSAKSTYGAARSWTAEVEGELTVSLPDVDRRAAEEARKLIAETDGVREARLLSKEEIDDLLEPSFGSRGLPESLPLPQLVAVTADPLAQFVGPNIERRLTEAGYVSAVDEHAEWAGDVRRVLGIARLVALTAVALLASTAVAVIAFATHAALLTRRDIVDVLHLAGARDKFIASLFERRFWLLGLRAGSVGALMSLGAAAAMIFAARSSGARSGLLPELSMDFYDLLILVLTPLIAGLAARLAARITVVRSLKSMM